MKDFNYWIEKLNMTSHPEGGYFKQTYASQYTITSESIGSDFDGKRSLSTSIYFLIHEGEVSNFHRLESDEMWYFHEGCPLTIAVISPTGELTYHKLGLNLDAGEQPQVLVPGGSIFGSYAESGYALVGCMVSYGFDFSDFTLYDRQTLLSTYPQHHEIVKKLTR